MDDSQEIIKPIIVDGKLMEGYFVSNTGNVYSSWVNGGSKRRSRLDYSIKKKLKPFKERSGYLRINIHFPHNTFNYTYQSKSKNSKQVKKCAIHALVIDAFKPFELYPPKILSKKDLKNTPESIRQVLKKLFLINHRDHNKLNNHIDNLERVTAKENSHKAKTHYNGNVANAKNKREIQC